MHFMNKCHVQGGLYHQRSNFFAPDATLILFGEVEGIVSTNVSKTDLLNIGVGAIFFLNRDLLSGKLQV